MLSKIFLGMSLIGAEWVLYFLLALSIVSISLIFERIFFYRTASKGLLEFRKKLRQDTVDGKLKEAKEFALQRVKTRTVNSAQDLEAEMAFALLSQSSSSPDILGEVAQDAVMRARLSWEKNLSVLATIGSNAPFIGLFGTVLGIIKAFHDLAQQSATGSQAITSGISEALVATAFGLLVAIPAVVAFNFFQRRVRSAMTEAEALKCFLIGKIATPSSNSPKSTG